MPDVKVSADPDLNVNKGPTFEDTEKGLVFPKKDLISHLSHFVFLFFIFLFLQVLAFMFVFDDEEEIPFFELSTSSITFSMTTLFIL